MLYCILVILDSRPTATQQSLIWYMTLLLSLDLIHIHLIYPLVGNQTCTYLQILFALFIYQKLLISSQEDSITESYLLVACRQTTPMQSLALIHIFILIIVVLQPWCSVYTGTGLEVLLDTFVHSSKEARVNGMVQNSVRFADIFNCPAGSAMNPQDKCTLWK